MAGRHSGSLTARLLAERERWPLWLPVFLGLGIALYFSLPVEPPFWVSLAAPVLAGALCRLVRARQVLLLLVLASAALALGHGAAKLRTLMLAHPVLAERHGPATLSGRIRKVEMFPKGARLTLDKVMVGGLRRDQVPERARIRLRGPQPDLAPGQWVEARAVLSPPSAPAQPGAFDFQRHAYFLKLGAVGFALGPVRVSAEAGEREGADVFVERLRLAVSERVLAALDGAPGAVAAALMTGKRGAIPEPVMNAFRASGLAHLLAISGLHIGLVAGILFFGLRALMALMPPLALRQPIKKWAALAAIAGAFAYAVLAGATVPTQRAFLMVGMVLAAVILDRQGLSMRMVAWAAAAILLVQPESLLGASFQMSFAAVVALIAAHEGYLRREHKGGTGRPWWRHPQAFLAGVALTTLIASTATAPFAVYNFNRFAAFALAANLIAVPLTSLFVMPAAVIAFCLMPFGLEALALVPMGWGLGGVIWVAETVAAWPGSVVLLPALPALGIGLVALGGLWLCLWRGGWRYWGTLGIAAGLAGFALVRPPDILVDGAGKLFAVRGGAGNYLVSSRRGARFTRETWLRRAGQGPAAAPEWPRRGSALNGRLACDGLGCIYRRHGLEVALVHDPLALMEDCRRADLVISRVPVLGACPSAMAVIDRFDLWRKGGHAVWIGPRGFRIESVAQRRGRRPWVLSRAKGRAGEVP